MAICDETKDQFSWQPRFMPFLCRTRIQDNDVPKITQFWQVLLSDTLGYQLVFVEEQYTSHQFNTCSEHSLAMRSGTKKQAPLQCYRVTPAWNLSWGATKLAAAKT